MNSYLKIILSLSLSSLSLFASHNHASDITKIEAQALAKLTQQLRTNKPVNIKPELDRLDEIAVEQIQEKSSSLQAATNIFGAAAIGALFIKATSTSLPRTRTPYKNISGDAIDSAGAETTKFLTGIEIPAILAMIPSTKTLLYGGLALGGLFALYEINRAIHAPCRAKFQLAEHKWGHQLELVRTDTEQKQEELRKTLTTLQTENSQIGASFTNLQARISEVKEDQLEINAQMTQIKTQLPKIQATLESMSRQAHWDLSKFRERAAATNGLKEQQANIQRTQEIDAMITSIEQNRKARESNSSIATYIGSTGPQRSCRPAPQTQTIRAIDNGAGVGFIRNPISQTPVAHAVNEVGCFGCFASGIIKKPTELR